MDFRPILPNSTYFILCPIQHLTKMPSEQYSTDLACFKKIATIPASAFYNQSNDGDYLIRFCFAKKNETLTMALNYLKI